MSKRLGILLIIFFLLVWENFLYAQVKSDNIIKADSFDIRNASFLLPQPLPKWKYYHSIAVSYVILPPDWTLDAINVPMLIYNGKFSLPYGFNFQGTLSTLFVSNRLNFGPFWNYSFNHFHFGIGYQFAFLYGYLGQFGYKTEITGWEDQPSMGIGYNFKKTALTVRGDLYYTRSLNANEGGHILALSNSFLNGYSVSASFEQRLYRNKVLSFGCKIDYLRYHFLAWPAFPVNQYRYIVPEFQVGLNL
ncbi:MAG TPA: hypothetical protein VMH01_08525 [Puia sp.]|nr:hypothetical protein [Puia sp.]